MLLCLCCAVTIVLVYITKDVIAQHEIVCIFCLSYNQKYNETIKLAHTIYTYTVKKLSCSRNYSHVPSKQNRC